MLPALGTHPAVVVLAAVAAAAVCSALPAAEAAAAPPLSHSSQEAKLRLILGACKRLIQ